MFGLDFSVPGQSLLAGCYEHGVETLASIG